MTLLWAALAAAGPPGQACLHDHTPDDLQITAERHHERVVLKIEVPCGLHVYGSKEPHGMPPQVTVNGEPVPARVPKGRRVVVDPELPASYWLEGTVRIEAKTAAHAGEIELQACSKSLCYPPERSSWRAP
ncbi:MAG: hypothetical protein KTR31_34225 [Myxococcales bacterium]|nr:hypothetical protein [Myxococcales bacterium]